MRVKDWFADCARGAAMGLGMVPGVSAGTMGIIVNIYDKLVTNISNLKKQFIKSFLILLPIGLGLVISSVLVLALVHKTFNYAPIPILSAFAGIIIGSMPVITKELKGQKISANTILLMALGFIVAFGIGVLSVVSKIYWNFDLGTYFVSGVWWVYILTFLAGFVAAAAMIIPGISGAMILFIFGLYNPILNMFSMSNPYSVFNNPSRIPSVIGLTLCLIVGIVAGGLIAGKSMKDLLDKHKIGTFNVVAGFVVGSIGSMFCNQELVFIPEGGSKFEWYYSINYTKPWMYILSIVLLIIFTLLFYFVSKKALKNGK